MAGKPPTPKRPTTQEESTKHVDERSLKSITGGTKSNLQTNADKSKEGIVQNIRG